MSWDLFNVFYLIVVIYSRLNMLSEKNTWWFNLFNKLINVVKSKLVRFII